jgi:hypothetical protein
MILPLFAEASLLALTGFAVGLFFAYLVGLHLRRSSRGYSD